MYIIGLYATTALAAGFGILFLIIIVIIIIIIVIIVRKRSVRSTNPKNLHLQIISVLSREY